ncbi:MAG: hypothetical protein AAB373_03660 [Patescibacteria group bacterium]
MTEGYTDLGPMLGPSDPMAADCYRANIACEKAGIGQNDVLALGMVVSDCVRDASDTGHVDFVSLGRAAAEGYAVGTLGLEDGAQMDACRNLGVAQAQWLAASLAGLEQR